MNEFIFNELDYTEFLNTAEDFKLFEKMKSYSEELKKPIAECYEAVIAVDKIHRKLIGAKPLIIIPFKGQGQQSNPILN
jgi:hypothetical protein